MGGGVKIRTDFIFPSIPDRRFDWSAIDEETYDFGKPIGYGRTEAEAVADLLEQIEEDEENTAPVPPESPAPEAK